MDGLRLPEAERSLSPTKIPITNKIATQRSAPSRSKMERKAKSSNPIAPAIYLIGSPMKWACSEMMTNKPLSRMRLAHLQLFLRISKRGGNTHKKNDGFY